MNKVMIRIKTGFKKTYTESHSFQIGTEIYHSAFWGSPMSRKEHVIISGFAPAGPGGAGDEWVELFNPTDSAVDITGWAIRYAAAVDAWGSVAEIGKFVIGSDVGGSVILQPGQYWLVIAQEFPAGSFDFANWGGVNGTNEENPAAYAFSDIKGSVLLRKSDSDAGILVDGVSYSTGGVPPVNSEINRMALSSGDGVIINDNQSHQEDNDLDYTSTTPASCILHNSGSTLESNSDLKIFRGIVSTVAKDINCIYIAPNGNDLNDGLSIANPVLTIKKAVEQVVINYSGNDKVMIKFIRNGFVGPPNELRWKEAIQLDPIEQAGSDIIYLVSEIGEEAIFEFDETLNTESVSTTGITGTYKNGGTLTDVDPIIAQYALIMVTSTGVWKSLDGVGFSSLDAVVYNSVHGARLFYNGFLYMGVNAPGNVFLIKVGLSSVVDVTPCTVEAEQIVLWNNTIYVICHKVSGQTVHYSTDEGGTWNTYTLPNPSTHFLSISVHNNTLYVITDLFSYTLDANGTFTEIGSSLWNEFTVITGQEQIGDFTLIAVKDENDFVRLYRTKNFISFEELFLTIGGITLPVIDANWVIRLTKFDETAYLYLSDPFNTAPLMRTNDGVKFHTIGPVIPLNDTNGIIRITKYRGYLYHPIDGITLYRGVDGMVQHDSSISALNIDGVKVEGNDLALNFIEEYKTFDINKVTILKYSNVQNFLLSLITGIGLNVVIEGVVANNLKYIAKNYDLKLAISVGIFRSLITNIKSNVIDLNALDMIEFEKVTIDFCENVVRIDTGMQDGQILDCIFSNVNQFDIHNLSINKILVLNTLLNSESVGITATSEFLKGIPLYRVPGSDYRLKNKRVQASNGVFFSVDSLGVIDGNESMGVYRNLNYTLVSFSWLKSFDLLFGPDNYKFDHLLKNIGEFENLLGDYNRNTNGFRNTVSLNWPEGTNSDFDQLDKLKQLIQIDEPVDVYFDPFNQIDFGTVTIDGTGSPITMTTDKLKIRENKYVGSFVEITDKTSSTTSILYISEHHDNTFILEDKLGITELFLVDANYSSPAKIVSFRGRVKASTPLSHNRKQIEEGDTPPFDYELSIDEIRNWI